ncbi:MAG: hypothetical protein RBU30_21300, partial [Polyangia bacterium]|nr:hypothetical protein [Polyangia bacterium]
MKNPCTHLLLLTLLGSTAGCFAVTDFEDLDTTRRESFELPFREQGEVPEFDILFVVDRPLAYNSAMFGAMDGLAGESGGMLNGVSSVLALPEYALD